MQHKIAIVMLVFCACGRSKKTAATEDAGTAVREVPTSARERETVRIAAGRIRVEDSLCEPDTLQLKRPGEKDRAHVDVEVPAFAIDRETALCHELENCVKAGRCKDLGVEPCVAGVAHVPVAAAAEFCAWRGLKLPTYAQWQLAMRGPKGFVYPRGNEWSEQYLSDQVVINRGRRYVSPDGVVYFISDLRSALNTEFTRDMDCVPEIKGPPLERAHVALGLHQFVLDTRFPFPADSPGQVRCVSE